MTTLTVQAAEFAKRRARLASLIGSDSVAVVATAPVAIRNRDAEYAYRPDSDFFYLTGFAEPEAVAVFVPGRRQGQFLLFCRERDPEMETWTGRRAGLDGAREIYGAHDAFPITDIDEILPGLLENKKRIFYALGKDPEIDQAILQWRGEVQKKSRSGIQAPGELIALDYLLHEMRLFKSPAEISTMRQAARIAAAAHRRAMQTCHADMMEYQLEAELLHEFVRRGARQPAYESIVGGGANGCTLHYRENNDKLEKGNLVLIDAGAEFEYYASDITRTFPVNGKFSPAQRDAYEVVLAAQLAAIEKVKPGNHWNDPHDAAVKVLTKGMVELGLLKGKPQDLIKASAYRRFYMHRTGHWLGMDVHDVGEYKIDGKWRLLEPGMVMTVEPGLYIPEGSPGVAKKWWNIGIRIEDDVLVTRTGNEVLSREAPKTIDDIEALMARQ